jgi:hypothetical protein
MSDDQAKQAGHVERKEQPCDESESHFDVQHANVKSLQQWIDLSA